MGNSIRYPLLRTPDLDLAFTAAQQLMSLAVVVEHMFGYLVTTSHDLSRYQHVAGIDCRAQTTPELAELLLDALDLHGRDRLMSAPVWDDGTCTVYGMDPRASVRLRTLPPVLVEVHLERNAPDEADRDLVAAAGPDTGSIYWSVGWPEIPELCLLPSPKYGGVEITVNSDDPDSDVPASTGDHTVWIHDNRDGALRVPWLGASIGLPDPRVIGPTKYGI
ncbi:hypothetical protein [Catellatospora sp. TT07R-123]|uniref:hypothetical protein n=1 Tax=Catellatospora sp. TT07R-123 TaxID=2733863 RepID=UPI001BB32D14|nr:hypothetical protein [Catellatospora sp. TT07R-123]